MGLSVVSQTRCSIDVFPAFALPITSTRNRICGNRGRLSVVPTVTAVGLSVVPAVTVVWLSVVRVRVIRLCAVSIGAVSARADRSISICWRGLRKPRVLPTARASTVPSLVPSSFVSLTMRYHISHFHLNHAMSQYCGGHRLTGASGVGDVPTPHARLKSSRIHRPGDTSPWV